MSKNNPPLPPELKSYIEFHIRYFKEDKEQIADIKASAIPSATPKYGPQTGGFNPEQRPVENATLKILSNKMIIQLELTVNAIESVYNNLSDIDKKLIALKYWSKRYTPDGIALKLGMSTSTLYIRLNKIHLDIAKRLGYFCELNEIGKKSEALPQNSY